MLERAYKYLFGAENIKQQEESQVVSLESNRENNNEQHEKKIPQPINPPSAGSNADHSSNSGKPSSDKQKLPKRERDPNDYFDTGDNDSDVEEKNESIRFSKKELKEIGKIFPPQNPEKKLDNCDSSSDSEDEEEKTRQDEEKKSAASNPQKKMQLQSVNLFLSPRVQPSTAISKSPASESVATSPSSAQPPTAIPSSPDQVAIAISSATPPVPSAQQPDDDKKSKEGCYNRVGKYVGAGVKKFFGDAKWDGSRRDKALVVITQARETILSALQLYVGVVVKNLLEKFEWEGDEASALVTTGATLVAVGTFFWTKQAFNDVRFKEKETKERLRKIEDKIKSLKIDCRIQDKEYKTLMGRLMNDEKFQSMDLKDQNTPVITIDVRDSGCLSKTQSVAKGLFIIVSINPVIPICDFFLKAAQDEDEKLKYLIVGICASLSLLMMWMTKKAFAKGSRILAENLLELDRMQKDCNDLTLNANKMKRKLIKRLEGIESYCNDLIKRSPEDDKTTTVESLRRSNTHLKTFFRNDSDDANDHKSRTSHFSENTYTLFCTSSGRARVIQTIERLFSASMSAMSVDTLYQLCKNYFGDSEGLIASAFTLGLVNFCITYNGFKSDCYSYDLITTKLDKFGGELSKIEAININIGSMIRHGQEFILLIEDIFKDNEQPTSFVVREKVQNGTPRL